MIELTNIYKSYFLGTAEVPVLKGVSLNVSDGELLAILGASGSGKSTLMNIIGLLDRPTKGSYAINKTLVKDMNDAAISELRNKTIGFIFQQYNLLPKMSVIENVSLPLLYRDLKNKEIKERCKYYIQLVGLGNKLDYPAVKLSGGQQQRVSIARALVGDPNLVLADEPTGALDSNTGQEIMDLFLKLNNDQKVTIILITHSPDIAKQCKRKVQIKDGNLI